MASCKLVLLVASVILGLTNAENDRPSYVGCVNSSECGQGECCLIQPGRYSIPSCTPLLPAASTCRPNNAPISMTAYYPDGAIVALTNVYSVVCECAQGLVCDKKTGGTCQQS